MCAKVKNMETGKPLHKFYDSLELGDLGESVIDTMCDIGMMDGEWKSTKKGDDLDRIQGVDGFIGDSNIQVKLDMQVCYSGSVALEVAEFKFLGGRIQPPKPGSLINPEHKSDFTIYVMPGIGVSVWKSSELNFLLWYWQSKYSFVNQFEEVENTFRHVVADNAGAYMSLSYLVPWKFMTYTRQDYENDLLWSREPLLYRAYYKFSDKDWEYHNYRGAGKFYLWTDYLAKLQSNLPTRYEKIFQVARNHAISQSWKPKREAILNAWGQPVDG